MNFFDIYGIVFITDRNKKKEIADGYKKFPESVKFIAP